MEKRKSKFDDAKYLTEFVNRRKAKKEKMELSDRYWLDPLWKVEYGKQIIAAQSLLKEFSLEAIIKALNSKEFNWAYSLKCRGLIDVIKREQAIINKNSVKIEVKQEEFNVKKEAEINVNVSKKVSKNNRFEGLDG